MKKLVEENVRVVIDVDYNQFIKDPEARFKDQKNTAAWLVEEIRRHCDGHTSVNIEWDSEERCEHCDATWTEGDSQHNGGCCDNDCDILDAEMLVGATVQVDNET